MAISTPVDLVKVVLLSTGTGPLILGAAVAAFRGLEALIDGRQYSYSIQLGGNFEVGQGLYSVADNSLTRGVILSSRGGAPVDFGAGALVTFTLLAQDLAAFGIGEGVTFVTLDGGATGLSASGGGTGNVELVLAGVLNPASGGTGATSLGEAVNLLLPDQTGNAGKLLGTDGTDPAWQVAGDVTLAGTQTLTNKTLTAPIITQAINARSGTTYTPVLSDQAGLVTLSNAAAITLTIPANATTAFPVGGSINFFQAGAGQVTIVGAVGVTVNGTPGLKFRAQYSAVTLFKLATNTWAAIGDLST